MADNLQEQPFRDVTRIPDDQLAPWNVEAVCARIREENRKHKGHLLGPAAEPVDIDPQGPGGPLLSPEQWVASIETTLGDSFTPEETALVRETGLARGWAFVQESAQVVRRELDRLPGFKPAFFGALSGPGFSEANVDAIAQRHDALRIDRLSDEFGLSRRQQDELAKTAGEKGWPYVEQKAEIVRKQPGVKAPGALFMTALQNDYQPARAKTPPAKPAKGAPAEPQGWREALGKLLKARYPDSNAARRPLDSWTWEEMPQSGVLPELKALMATRPIPTSASNGQAAAQDELKPVSHEQRHSLASMKGDAAEREVARLQARLVELQRAVQTVIETGRTDLLKPVMAQINNAIDAPAPTNYTLLNAQEKNLVIELLRGRGPQFPAECDALRKRLQPKGPDKEPGLDGQNFSFSKYEQGLWERAFIRYPHAKEPKSPEDSAFRQKLERQISRMVTEAREDRAAGKDVYLEAEVRSFRVTCVNRARVQIENAMPEDRRKLIASIDALCDEKRRELLMQDADPSPVHPGTLHLPPPLPSQIPSRTQEPSHKPSR